MRDTDFVALRQRCVRLIEKHYRNVRVDPTWLAGELYVSRRQLDRAFIDGPSVAEVLARRRLRQAVAVAALNSGVPMSKIARRCGYATYETFRAQCHRYLHRSPRAARSDCAVALRASRGASFAV